MPGDALCKLMANAAVASVLKKVAGLRVARLNERVVNWTPTCYLEDTQFKIDVPLICPSLIHLLTFGASPISSGLFTKKNMSAVHARHKSQELLALVDCCLCDAIGCGFNDKHLGFIWASVPHFLVLSSKKS